MQDQSSKTAVAPDRLLERAGRVLRDLLAEPLPPGLYLVATPIGNLGDISLRALSVLARADLVAAEDTRHSRKLLSHYGLSPELSAYHEHNAAKERPRLLARLKAGFSVALVCDAGTPLVSDPGYKLVREALQAGLAVTSIPGPSAALAALTSSGLPSDTFLFAGFLPAKQGPRRSRLAELRNIPATLVFFEAPSRIGKSLADMADVLGARVAVVAKELTKLHDRIVQGSLSELAARFAAETAFKGEITIVVGPPQAAEKEASDDAIARELYAALKRESFRDAVRTVSEMLNVPRGRVYAIGLRLREGK